MGVFNRKHEVERSTPATFSSSAPVERQQSVIGKTLFIKGEVNSDEEVIIDGKIEGKLNIRHRVVVERNGVVNADIEAREVVIKGTVNGNVKGNFKVEIIPEGVLNGNIISQRVVLAEGAVFKGNIDMTVKEEKQPANMTENLSAAREGK
ncbi:MAG: polymer-forming cytoskeletal protein [bacterium]|nr:polymer-forming cytoskeletal protein [bacterium]